MATTTHNNNFLAYREGERSFGALWYLRIVGLIGSIIVLGLTASSVANFLNIGCSSPSKLSFNLAVSVLSFLVLIYLILSTGPTSIAPWFIYGQLAIDLLLFIFWLAAGSVSQLNCNDLCYNACNGVYDSVSYGDKGCDCNIGFFWKDKRDTSPNPARRAVLVKRDGDGQGGVATTAFDAIMTILFAVCLALTIFWFFQSRKATRGGAGHTYPPPPVAGEPIKHEEAGMAAPAMYPQGGVAPQQQQQPPMQYQQQPYGQQQPQQQYQQPPYQGQPQMYQQQQQQPPIQTPAHSNQQQAPYAEGAGAAAAPAMEQPQQQPYQQQQQQPQMSATGGPMQDPYAHQEGTGAAEMSPIGQKTMDGTRAPEVHTPTA